MHSRARTPRGRLPVKWKRIEGRVCGLHSSMWGPNKSPIHIPGSSLLKNTSLDYPDPKACFS